MKRGVSEAVYVEDGDGGLTLGYLSSECDCSDDGGGRKDGEGRLRWGRGDIAIVW